MLPEDELVLEVSVGGRRFALPLAATGEIVEVASQTLVPIAGQPPSVLGLWHLRGRLLWVIELAQLLGLPPASLTEKRPLIIVSHAGVSVALAVEAPGGVVAAAEAGELLDPARLLDPAQGLVAI